MMIRVFKKTVAVVALVVALVAISAPAASATIGAAAPVGGHSVNSGSSRQQSHTVSTTKFTWGDAAIGAGGMVVLIGLAYGAVLLVRRGHQPATG
jgi:hypothetical protein